MRRGRKDNTPVAKRNLSRTGNHIRNEPIYFLPSEGGRPRGRCSGGASLTPRRWSASRRRHSISALTLLRLVAAARSSAAHKAGSIRSGNAFVGGGGMAAVLLVERAGVDDRLGVAFRAERHHQVRDHRRPALIV